jgi:hypothetical protein
MSEPIRDPELAALETALGSLAPRPGVVDRDALLFRAGQASLRRCWAWPAATALLAVLSAALGAGLLLRPAPQVTERIVYVPVPEPAAPTPRAADTPLAAAPRPGSKLDDDDFQAKVDSLKLRNRVMSFGVEVLPKPPPPSGPGRVPSLEGLLGPDAPKFLRKSGDPS